MKKDMLRFVLPVTLENTVTIFLGILLSMLLGGVSESALAAASVPNTLINVYIAVFSVLTIGAAGLTSRLLGAEEKAEAGRTIEQSIVIGLIASAAMGLVSLLLAENILKMLMPNAEEALLRESLAYFRMLALSFPFYAIYNTLTSVMRAAGDSRAPMVASFVMNGVQIACILLFLNGLNMGMTGAGLSYLVCRMVGAGMLFVRCLKEKQLFVVKLRNMFRFDVRIARRIARLGLPTIVETTLMQVGHLVANTMAVGLGTAEGTVYQISISLLSFASVTSAICSPIVTNYTGHRLGAKDKIGARRVTLQILAWGGVISVILSVGIALLGVPLGMLYTDDVAIARDVMKMMWVLLGYNICAISINVLDPALRVGGDVKYVMCQTIICVSIRLVLTWLQGTFFSFGVIGIFVANILSLMVQTAMGWIRFLQGKWMHIRV